MGALDAPATDALGSSLDSSMGPIDATIDGLTCGGSCLANAGFESGDTTSWTASAATASAAAAHSGGFGARLDMQSSTACATTADLYEDVSYVGPVTVNFWSNQGCNTGETYSAYELTTSPGGSQIGMLATGSWTQTAVVIPAGQTLTRIRFYIYDFHCGIVNSCTLDVDDIAVQ
jgi:hypothetical protein